MMIKGRKNWRYELGPDEYDPKKNGKAVKHGEHKILITYKE
jgi:hypothetical protein